MRSSFLKPRGRRVQGAQACDGANSKSNEAKMTRKFARRRMDNRTEMPGESDSASKMRGGGGGGNGGSAERAGKERTRMRGKDMTGLMMKERTKTIPISVKSG